jgi:hypothetical protein
MSNVQFTNLPAAIAVTNADIVAIVQANVSKRATIQQIKDILELGGGTVTSVTGEGTVNGITLTGEVTESGALTLGGSLSGVSLTSQVSGILPAANGGTGASSLSGLVVGNGGSAFTAVSAPSGSVVGTTDVQTLTNKKITQRSSLTQTQTSPLSWNSDNFDIIAIAELANNLTISADSGSPTNGQKMMFRIKDNGTARTLAWTTATTNGFRAVGVTLPTTTTANKTLYIGCIFNSGWSSTPYWDVVALAQEA